MKQTSLACELPALPRKPFVCWIAKVAFILCTQTPFISLSPAKMLLHLRMHARSWMEIIAPSVIRFLRWWLLSARSSPGFLKRWGQTVQNQHFEAGKGLLLKFSFHFSFFFRFFSGVLGKCEGTERKSRICSMACRPLAGIFFLFSFRRLLDGTEPLNYFFS